MASDSVGSERISRITGYKLTAGDFSEVSPNLPQRIALLSEGNDANQASMPLVPTTITSAQQAGLKWGFGSPTHINARILFPVNGGGVGGIPVIVYPQVAAGGAVAKEMTITIVGAATANAIHNVVVGGREGVDGENYSFTVETGDSVTDIAVSITDSINNVLGSPITATSAVGVVTVVTKWKGLTSGDLEVSVNDNDNGVGVTYAVAKTVDGLGTPSVATALSSFGNEWNTIVINSYGLVVATLDELEAFNGIPDPTNPTGRFLGIIMKPIIALTGSISNSGFAADTVETIARRNEVTIAVCPAPKSQGFSMEAAANMCVLFARVSQDNPHLDVAGKSYQDMPTGSGLTVMSSYDDRDAYVKAGHSTVDIVAGVYQVQDFVTTYHPLGEAVPAYRFCRNLVIDFNVKYGYHLLEEINVVDHAIAEDDDTVGASKVIKPKQWIALLSTYSEDLTNRALITEPSFMQDSLVVNLSTINPDRLETFFRYKRTGFVRIAATTAEAGFNFGS